MTMVEIDARREVSNGLLTALRIKVACHADTPEDHTALASARDNVEEGLREWWAQRDAEGWK